MHRVLRSLTFYILILLLAVSVVNYFSNEAAGEEEIDYTAFIRLLEEGRVTSVIITESRVTGTLDDGQEFATVILPDDARVLNLLHQQQVEMRVQPPVEPPWWTNLLMTMLPVAVVVAAFFFLMQQSQGGGNRVMQFGRSRARVYGADDKRRVTFAEVAGCDEVKEELQEIVDYLKHPKRYLDMGARIPKGILLMGAPGTGKTLVARAVAGEAGVPFFTISGSDFVEMFVGVGASRVRDLFDQAKKSSPAIVFIDEIDAVGRQRGAGYGGGHDEREQTLNQLLVEMDGFSVNEGIIVMAATNRPDVLDPALLRPGRFDRQVVIDRPDIRGRQEILAVHSRTKPLERDVDFSLLARRTPGMTGADLENVMNEASLLAARRRKKKIGMEELKEAVDRVMAGPERKSRVISDKEKRIVAYHEAAHALVARLTPNAEPVRKVSIIPRGAALGYVLQLPLEDRYLITKPEILVRITVALAGRAAEQVVFDEISSGAHDDLEKATRLARKMITEFGMSEALGPLTFGQKYDSPFLGRDMARDRDYSEEVAATIDREVRAVIHECYTRATELLQKHRDRLEQIADALLERETLEDQDLEDVLGKAELKLATGQ
ncbi:MAG TPA: ATP-dependent zinc metalloprotease FtsH [Bacillota bacterium]|nr:ATP-dependent zinc metalloprotease FtsH [Bacillota bacterium]